MRRTILIACHDDEIILMLAMHLHRLCNVRVFDAVTDQEAEFLFVSRGIDGIILVDSPDRHPSIRYEALLRRVREIGSDGPVIAASTDRQHNNLLLQLGCTHQVPYLGGVDVPAAARMAVKLTRQSPKKAA